MENLRDQGAEQRFLEGDCLPISLAIDDMDMPSFSSKTVRFESSVCEGSKRVPPAFCDVIGQAFLPLRL